MAPARSPIVAALLSLLFPGLGQMYAGATRRGLFLALPVALLLIILVLLLTGGMRRLVDLMVNPVVLVTFVVLLVMFFLYHAAAIVDAYRIAAGASPPAPDRRGASSGVLVVLLAVAVLLYGIPGYLGVRTAFLVGGVQDPGTVFPSPSFDPEPTNVLPPPSVATPAGPGSPSTEPGSTDQPQTPRTASARPGTARCPQVDGAWAADGRLDLLLLGADTGPGRFSTRTDTMILLSVDVATCRAALFGFPRNMTNVPLPAESAGAYPGGRFPEFLFGLWRRAMEQPQSFPGDDSVRGWRAVGGAIQELAGVPIDGMVAVNLNGFVGLVDALGGLWIDVPRRLRDDSYPLEDGSGSIKIDIKRGCQKLDGRLALAYARSREQDDDYQRMRRQQLVLTAFRKQFDPLALLPRVNDLFDIAEGNLHLFIDLNEIGDLAAIASGVNADRIRRVTFAPPRFASPLDDATIARVRTSVRTVFDGPEPRPSPSPSGSPRPTCPP